MLQYLTVSFLHQVAVISVYFKNYAKLVVTVQKYCVVLQKFYQVLLSIDVNEYVIMDFKRQNCFQFWFIVYRVC